VLLAGVSPVAALERENAVLRHQLAVLRSPRLSHSVVQLYDAAPDRPPRRFIADDVRLT
jgi:hypothetical protein